MNELFECVLGEEQNLQEPNHKAHKEMVLFDDSMLTPHYCPMFCNLLHVHYYTYNVHDHFSHDHLVLHRPWTHNHIYNICDCDFLCVFRILQS